MTGIEGRSVLVLGGGGMVGTAVCRELARHEPARIAIAARREAKARRAVAELAAAFPEQAERFVPLWGDVFLRAEWQEDGGGRDAVIASDSRDLAEGIVAILTQDVRRREFEKRAREIVRKRFVPDRALQPILQLLGLGAPSPREELGRQSRQVARVVGVPESLPTISGTTP